MHNYITEETCSLHFPGIINIVYSWSQEVVAITTMEKLKIASFILYCLRWNYDMLWCFRAGNSLSCGKCLQTFFNKAIFVQSSWITSSNYLPDPVFQDSLLTYNCFDMFLGFPESLLENCLYQVQHYV